MGKKTADNRRKSASRELVKAGMVMSMGAALYTGLAAGRAVRLLHPWSGLALLGFSLWHLGQNTGKRTSRTS